MVALQQFRPGRANKTELAELANYEAACVQIGAWYETQVNAGRSSKHNRVTHLHLNAGIFATKKALGSTANTLSFQFSKIFTWDADSFNQDFDALKAITRKAFRHSHTAKLQ